MNSRTPNALGHYLGMEGQEYFRWQDRLGTWSGVWNARFFQAEIHPTDSVLDFGCGAGHLLAALTAGHKVGVEVNPAARQAALHYGLQLVPSLTQVDGTPFDVVISCHALEHVPTPLDTLIGLRSRLRTDGRLVLLLPLDDWRSADQRRYHVDDVNMHLHCWTPQALGNLLRAAEFRSVKVRIVTRAFPPRGDFLWGIGRPVFEAAATLAAMLKRRRQLLAVATR